MSLAQTFRDLIFEDCVRARRRLTVSKILIRENRENLVLENFKLYGINKHLHDIIRTMVQQNAILNFKSK